MKKRPRPKDPPANASNHSRFSSFTADLTVPLHAFGESNLAAAAAEASPLCRRTQARNEFNFFFVSLHFFEQLSTEPDHPGL